MQPSLFSLSITPRHAPQAFSASTSQRQTFPEPLPPVWSPFSQLAADTVKFSSRTPSFKTSDADRNADIDQQLAITETAAFQEAFNQVVEDLKQYLSEQKQLGKTGFVVLDIDETTLDNRGFFRDPEQKFYKKGRGKEILRQAWGDWVTQATSPAIPATKRLIEWMNAEGIPYLFLTGIQESLSESSKTNLKDQGVWGPQCLGAYYRPDNVRANLAQFKKDKREELSDRFKLNVLASIGDRTADMTDEPEKNFLLPGYIVNLRTRND